MELKLDLTYLKKLVSELEALAASAESKKDPENSRIPYEYLMDLNKAAGVLLGLSEESKMLITDVAQLVRIGSVPKDDRNFSADDLFGGGSGRKDPFGNAN